MASLDLLPDLYLRLAVMISLTAAFGGLGFLFMVSFSGSSTSILTVEYFGRVLLLGIALVILFVSGLNFLRIPITKLTLSIVILSFCGASSLRLFNIKPKIHFQASFSKLRYRTDILIPISLFLLLLFWRVVQIKDVFVPNWYDGLIHTYLLEEFSLKSNVPFDHLYHIGFHAITLVVHFFWKLNFQETVLLSGQWLSVVCGISFYIIARRYIRDPFASGFSLVVFLFILLFPSLLISWGHYPYLLGFALLPPAVLTSQDWINNRKSTILEPLIFVISLSLIQYGLLLIWFSFILVYLINQIIFKEKFRKKVLGNNKGVFLRPFYFLFPVSMIILPNTFHSPYLEMIQSNMLSRFYITDFGFSTQYVLRLFRTHDSFFIYLWIFWLFWSLIWSRRLLYVTMFWPLATWLIVWIQYQVLENPILTYVNLIVFLSIPISISIGLLARQMLWVLIKLDASNSLPGSKHRMKSRLLILVTIAMLAGIFTSPLSIDQRTALFTDEDLPAMRWIIDHTAKDSGFLIRSVSWGNDGLIPSDGGGWIPLLTGRRAIIPEKGELYDICQFAADHDVQYLYFGKERGSDQFDLRLSDPEIDTYVLVYGSKTVEIVSLRCT